MANLCQKPGKQPYPVCAVNINNLNQRTKLSMKTKIQNLLLALASPALAITLNSVVSPALAQDPPKGPGIAMFDNSAPVTGDWVTFGYGTAIIDGAETTATYGQTFTAPSVRPSTRRTYLDEWTFYLQQIPIDLGGLGTRQSFEVFVMAWDANTGTATGPILYHSQRLTVDSDMTAYTPFTVYPDDLALTPGAQYVIFINLSLQRNDNNPIGSSLEMAGNGSGGLFPGPYTTSPLGGQFVYQYTVGDFDLVEDLDAALTTQEWYTWAVNEYAVYDAVFSDEETPRHHRH
jgi:hypothetical protein